MHHPFADIVCERPWLIHGLSILCFDCWGSGGENPWVRLKTLSMCTMAGLKIPEVSAFLQDFIFPFAFYKKAVIMIEDCININVLYYLCIFLKYRKGEKTMKSKIVKKALTLALATGMAMGLMACGGVPANTVHSVDDMVGKKIGVQLGTTGDIFASDFKDEDTSGKTVVEKYSKGADAVQALKQGKIDCVIIDQ